jgi:hypothetical protein
VNFPNELIWIDGASFDGCVALVEVDLSKTRPVDLRWSGFAGSGVTRLSLPATLKTFDKSVISATPLTVLDLSVCRDVMPRVSPAALGVEELRLPPGRFAETVGALLPGSRVEVLEASIDAYKVKWLVKRLEDRLVGCWRLSLVDTSGSSALGEVSRRLGSATPCVGRRRQRDCHSASVPRELTISEPMILRCGAARSCDGAAGRLTKICIEALDVQFGLTSLRDGWRDLVVRTCDRG